MSIGVMLLLSFAILGFMNVPIAVALGLSSCVCLVAFGLDMSVLPTQVYSGIAKFVLLAVPFFISTRMCTPACSPRIRQI